MSTPESSENVPDPLVSALREAGYVVAEGSANVEKLIHAISDDNGQLLCSGWRVFPGGVRCPGCADCNKTHTPQ